MTFPHVHGDHDPCPISRRLGATTRDWRAMPPPSSALQARCASCCRSSPPSLRGSQSSGGRTPPVHNPTTRQMKAYTTAQAIERTISFSISSRLAASSSEAVAGARRSIRRRPSSSGSGYPAPMSTAFCWAACILLWQASCAPVKSSRYFLRKASPRHFPDTDSRRRVLTHQSLVGNLGDTSAPTPH